MSEPRIHPLAVVASGARLGPGCEVRAFAVIGPEVSMGADNMVEPHAVIDGCTEIGDRNLFQAHCHVGGPPQQVGAARTGQRLRIGDGNTIGDFVSVSGGLGAGTRLGDGGLLMAYAHVGHDCLLGDGIRMANGATLAGHVEVQDGAWLSGQTAAHQFVRIGRDAFVAGGAIVTQDVPPFCLVQGDRARLVGLNRVGLERAGVQAEEMAALRRAFRMLFLRQGPLRDRMDSVATALGDWPRVGLLLDFLGSSERGCITTPRRTAA